MKLAIMQPYLFPYIGYFQLINASDKFVFYDDVNFIKGGWINRNYILSNGEKQLFTLHLQGASSFKKINEIKIGGNSAKILKFISQAYVKAPHFSNIIPIIENIFSGVSQKTTISDIAIRSIKEVCQYLNINKEMEISSHSYAKTALLKREERVIEICRLNNSHSYINSEWRIFII